MATCSWCGAQIDTISGYDCRYCTGMYCSDHRLPENHGCPGGDRARPPGKAAAHIDIPDTGSDSTEPLGFVGWFIVLALLVVIGALVLRALMFFGLVG